MTSREFKILAPTGILGYGFPLESFEAGLAMKPDLIACDGGSTDPGPYYLGSGQSFVNASAVKRDLTIMLRSSIALAIPLIIGTVGGSGSDIHMKRDLEILQTIAREEGLSFRLATISAEINHLTLLTALKENRIEKLGPAPQVTQADIHDSNRVVAQMGTEPIIQALDQGAQVILCGRCYDPAAFAAPAIRMGYDQALALHLGKLLECAAICATPGSGSDCIIGFLGQDYFRVEALNPQRRCTPLSVSAHTLYEKSNPYLLPGPGGTLDISGCEFEATSNRAVQVRGSRFIPEDKPSVKLEGTKKIGYRTIALCGNRDPIFISNLDGILKCVKGEVSHNLPVGLNYRLDFIVYGKDGVMGKREPKPLIHSHEVGLVIDVLADSQEEASMVCSLARSILLHAGYPGRVATAGNLAFPFSPSDIEMGPVYEFNIYALLRGEEPLSLFRPVYRTIEEVRNGA